MIPLRAFKWMAVASAIAGCEPESGSQTFEALPNGGVVATAGDVGLWEHEPTEAWSLSPGLALTGADVPLGMVAHVALDRQGRVYVADRQAATIAVFDTLGVEIRRTGSSGQGPGEFTALASLGVDSGGGLWVADVSAFHVFSADGAFERSVQRGDLSGGSVPWQRLVDSSGCLWDESRDPENITERLICRRCELDAPPVCQSRPPHVQPMFVSESTTSRNTIVVPNAPGLLLDVDGEGNVWSLSTGEYRITKRSWTGDALLIVEKMERPRPLTPEEKEQARDMRRSVEQMGFRLVDGGLPQLAPVVVAFAVTESGELFVVPSRTLEDGRRVIDVFGADGLYLGALPTDWRGPVERIFVNRASELVLLVRDSVGQQVPRYHHIRRPAEDG